MFLLCLLGGASVDGPAGPLRGRVVQRRQLALLAVLDRSRAARINRDRISALLWPDCSDDRARALLSDTLHVVRKSLGMDAIRTTAQDLALDVTAVRSDVHRFDEALAAGQPEAALALYAGPFLDGFHGVGGAELERWVDAERARLRTAAVSAARALCHAREAAGSLDDAMDAARRALEIEPYHELAARALIGLQVRAGDRAGAVRTLDAFVERLRTDLGVEPAPATMAVVGSPIDAADKVEVPVLAPRRRLAVLPFTDLLNDPDQEYLLLGMHDGVITELARSRVPVVARTSVMCYARGGASVRDIGRALGVQAVLEGTAVRAGASIRIRARLIDTDSEEPVWVGDYDIDPADALGAHQRITSAIACAAQRTVQPDSSTVAPRAEVDARAYEAYLRGRFHYFRFTPRDMGIALRCFERALEHQPDYPQPHAGIAHVHAALGVMGVLRPDDAMPQSRTAALRALQLDALLPEAHHALASVLAWYDFDFRAADTEFVRAIECNPSYADAHAFHGHLLTVTARIDEGAAALERALVLDPLNPFLRVLFAVHLMLVGQYDEAMATARAALEVTGDLLLGHMCLWGSCHRVGRDGEALAAAMSLFALQRDDEVVSALRADGAGDYRARLGAAADLLAARARRTFVRPFVIALMYDHAGDVDRAFTWLDAACRGRDHDCAYLGGLPLSDSLREDTRYVHLLRRLRLPDLRPGRAALARQ